MRVAYLVSRFPVVTETFILRELTAVDRQDGVDVELLSLFPAAVSTVHPAAEPWLERVHRPSARATLESVAWWSARAPGTMARILLAVTRDYLRRPDVLIRALVTVACAAQHARTVQRVGVEHVHAHYATYPALAARTIASLAGTSYSVTPHAHDLFLYQHGLARTLRQARFVVAISQFNRGFLKALGVERTPVIRYGIDLSAYRYRPRRPPAEGRSRALFVSSFRDYKGHSVLVEALALGGPRMRQMQVILVGEGPLRQSIERLARDRGVAGQLEFAGALSESEVADRLAEVDVLVQPSIVTPEGLTEGIPNTLIEAMASGVPVVSSRVSGIPELVRHGETGLLAEPGDPADLAAAIERVLGDPDAAYERAVAGRTLVEREYEVESVARRLSALFRSEPS